MLRGLLLLSLLINVFLVYRLYQAQVSFLPTNTQSQLDLSEPNSDSVNPAMTSSSFSKRLSQSPSEQGLKAQILTLYEQAQWQRLGPLLSQYLAEHPRDWQILFIEGQYLIHTQTSAEGIAYLYQLKNQVDDPAIATNIAQYIETHMQHLIRALVFNQDWHALSLLLEPLIQVDPLHRGFIEYLAISYAEQNLPNAMYNTLGAVTQEDAIYRRVEERWLTQFGQNQNNNSASADSSLPVTQQASSIDLVPFGNQWLSQVMLGGQNMALLLDTGASTTAIGQTAFARIPSTNTRFLGRITVNTANGQSQGELYRLSGAAIGQWEFAEIDIVVLNQDEIASDFDGLLGMNLLNRFAWQLDAVDGKLLLAEPSL